MSTKEPKHVYPFQTKQLESTKYCKPKDFNIGPSQIREAAFKKLRDEHDAHFYEGKAPLTDIEIFRK